MPPTITERHPPLPLEELIDAIKSLAEKRALIELLVRHHPTLSYKWGGPWRYRRARKLRSGEVPSTVDDLIWRKGIPAALGRANPAGFQVLYLADRRDTAFREARATNDEVVIAEFGVLPGGGIHVVPIGELAQIQRTGRGFLGGNASSVLSDMINACDRDEAKALLITDAFLLECLTNRDDDYELSSCVAKSIFDKHPFVSAIAYPSVRQLGAMNFAVRVEHFWNDWGVKSVRRGRAVHLAQGYYRLTDITHVDGITIAGSLQWNSAVDAEEDTAVLLDPLWVPRL